MGNCMTGKNQDFDSRSAVTEPFPYSIPLNEVQSYTQKNICIYAEGVQDFESSTLYSEIRDLNVQVFSSQEDLRQYKEDAKNNFLVLCLKNHENYKKYQSIFNVYNKIAIAIDFQTIGCKLQKQQSYNQKMLEKYRKQMRLSTNHGKISIIPLNSSSIAQFIRKTDHDQEIYLFDIDKAQINRTFVTYDYFFLRHFSHQRKLFHDWLAQQGEEGLRILQNIKDTPEQSLGNKILPNIFAGHRIYMQAIKLLGRCRNPIVLPHISWFCNYLFNFIRKNYQKSKQQIMKKHRIVYAFVDLTKQQVEKMCKSQKSNFMFSTFKIGSIINTINGDKSQENNSQGLQSYKFSINIPQKDKLDQYLKEVDLGFYVDNDKAILNILNIYKIDSINKSQREISVTYSIIGQQTNLRRTQDIRYMKNAKRENITMMKLYDFYLFNKQNIDNQMDLIFTLQLYETYLKYINNDLQISNPQLQQSQDNSRFSAIRCSLSSEIFSTLQTTYKPSKNFKESIGDSFAALSQYEQAEKVYLSLDSKVTGYAKLLYMYYKNKNQIKFKKAYQQVSKLMNFDTKFKHRFLKIVIDNFKSIILMRHGQVKEASKQINNAHNELSKQFSQKYVKGKEFHEEAIKSFPLRFILVKTGFQIDEKIGDKNSAALNLDDYEDNWLNFQGIHIYLLP